MNSAHGLSSAPKGSPAVARRLLGKLCAEARRARHLRFQMIATARAPAIRPHAHPRVEAIFGAWTCGLRRALHCSRASSFEDLACVCSGPRVVGRGTGGGEFAAQMPRSRTSSQAASPAIQDKPSCDVLKQAMSAVRRAAETVKEIFSPCEDLIKRPRDLLIVRRGSRRGPRASLNSYCSRPTVGSWAGAVCVGARFRGLGGGRTNRFEAPWSRIDALDRLRKASCCAVSERPCPHWAWLGRLVCLLRLKASGRRGALSIRISARCDELSPWSDRRGHAVNATAWGPFLPRPPRLYAHSVAAGRQRVASWVRLTISHPHSLLGNETHFVAQE